LFRKSKPLKYSFVVASSARASFFFVLRNWQAKTKKKASNKPPQMSYATATASCFEGEKKTVSREQASEKGFRSFRVANPLPNFSPMLPVPSVSAIQVQTFPQAFNNDPGLFVSSDHPGHGPCRIHRRRAISPCLSHRLHRLRIFLVLSPLLSRRSLSIVSALLLFLPDLSPL
jgi:hypothetical protein